MGKNCICEKVIRREKRVLKTKKDLDIMFADIAPDGNPWKVKQYLKALHESD